MFINDSYFYGICINITIFLAHLQEKSTQHTSTAAVSITHFQLADNVSQVTSSFNSRQKFNVLEAMYVIFPLACEE